MLVLRFTKTHTLNRIINYSTLKIFRVFNFRRNAISTKINYGENFRIYGNTSGSQLPVAALSTVLIGVTTPCCPGPSLVSCSDHTPLWQRNGLVNEVGLLPE